MIHELSVFSYCFAIKKILEFYVRHYLGGTFSLFLLLPCTFLFFGFISNSFSLLFLSVFSYCFENRPVNSCMINSTGNNFQSFLIASLQISITETKALKRSTKLSVFSYCFKWIVDKIAKAPEIISTIFQSFLIASLLILGQIKSGKSAFMYHLFQSFLIASLLPVILIIKLVESLTNFQSFLIASGL